MRIRDIARSIKEKLTDKKSASIPEAPAQQAQEAQKEAQAENSAPEAEKEQEGAKTEATAASEEDSKAAAVIIGIDLAAGEDMTAMAEVSEENQKKIQELLEGLDDSQMQAMREYAEQMGMKLEELAECIVRAGDAIRQAWDSFMERLRPAIQAMAAAMNDLLTDVDEWELEKMKMSNNERRRRGLPMVRRQAYLRSRRNKRRK